MTEQQPITAQNVDLSNCDREQIQYPAATLAHGFLLALSEPDYVALQAGRNAAAFLSTEGQAVTGRPIHDLLPAAAVSAVLREARRERVDGPPVHVSTADLNGRMVDLFLHRCAGALILEGEDRVHAITPPDRDLHSGVHQAIRGLQQEPTLQAFLNRAVVEIREFTGFDRVMAYEFLEDGSGFVRAEAVGKEFESFLGLQYPASDIPLPARRLFKMVWLRHQPDIDYTPVPIEPAENSATGKPLDLSYALLRSVSVMYSQYLKNMGTQSSMVMTLLKNGELWGLVACHHHSGPRHIPFEVRAACEYLAHMVSLLLSAKAEQEDYEYKLELRAALSGFLRDIPHLADPPSAILERKPGLLELIRADGVAVIDRGKAALRGTTPDAEQVIRLAEWLGATPGRELYTSDRLAADYPPAAEFTAEGSGIVAIRTGVARSDYVIWFRPGQDKVVRWAGDPQKPVDLTPDGRLFPRTSFAIWKESVKGCSRPWKPAEIDAARELQTALLDSAWRRAEQAQALLENLQRANTELDAFAYIASHDLKEPLRGIHNYSQFLMEDVADALSPQSREKLQTIVRLTRRMDDLLDSLLHYARLGRQGLEIGICDTDEMVAEVLDTLADRIQSAGAEVRVERPLPRVRADFIRLSEVFMNLVVNALKYNDKAHKTVEIGCRPAAGEYVFFVRDNGIGIDAADFESIFAIFRRLHARDKFGGGTGAGLTIVRKILERHGGRIWVESQPGAGSTFYFTVGTKS